MSAALVTASCPYCGEVKVYATALSMLLYPDDTGHYLFRCPTCREMITKEASASTVHLLRSVHVTESRIRPHAGARPPLTEDDLISFGRSIEGGEDPWRELDATSLSHHS